MREALKAEKEAVMAQKREGEEDPLISSHRLKW